MVGALALRVLVWLYINAGLSVFATALCQMAFNVAWQLFPIHGSFMDQRITGLMWAAVAAVIVIVWGPRTLTRTSRLDRG